MINKRFIAGAVCPRCSEMDKIFTYEQDGRLLRACVRCDFVEEMTQQTPQRELPTRITPKPQVAEEPIQVLKFFPPKKDRH